MDLELLAKDPESGRQGCPSVHRDRDAGEGLVVQGDGVVAVPFEGGRATVRIAVSIVREALRARGIETALADGELFVTGDEIDVSLLPNPLPGERAVRASLDDLVGGVNRLSAAQYRASRGARA